VSDSSPTSDFDTRAFRDALGTYATGVALITTQSDRGPVGIMVNSFASVSLEPPLVLWSIDNDSKRKPAFDANSHSVIHILSQAQQEACMKFTKDAFDFEGLPLRESVQGMPVIEDCIAHFECEHHASHIAGDHTIIVNRVTAVSMGDADPLVFHKGAFGTLS